MHKQKAGKLLLDMVMVVLLAVAMASRVTGATAHERLGVIVLALFVIHNVANRYWYKTVLKGRYNYIRLFSFLVNMLLIFLVLATTITGIMASGAVFPMASGQVARQVHSLTAHWLLVLVGVHLGLYWGRMLAAMFKALAVNAKNPVLAIGLKIAALVIVIGGVKASFAKDVGAKLVMYFSFSFWNESQVALFYIFDYLLVLAFYACLSHYLFKVLKIFHKVKTAANVKV